MKLSEIRMLTEDELYKQLKSVSGKRDTAKKATKDWKENIPELGKLYYDLEVRLVTGKRTVDENGRAVTPRFSQSYQLSDLIQHVTGGKAVDAAYQTKNCFAFWVGGDEEDALVPEAKYDGLPTQVVILAGRIANLVGHDLGSEHRYRVADLLNGYDKNTGTELKRIIAELQPAEPMETADAEALVQKLDEENNLGTVIAAIVRRSPATVSETLTLQVPHLTQVMGQRVYVATLKTVAAFDTAQDEKGERRYAPETLDAWSEQLAPHQVNLVTAAPEPATEVAEPAEVAA